MDGGRTDGEKAALFARPHVTVRARNFLVELLIISLLPFRINCKNTVAIKLFYS